MLNILTLDLAYQWILILTVFYVRVNICVLVFIKKYTP